MVFSSVIFLFYFLPIVLIVYFAAGLVFRGGRGIHVQNGILLIASLLFYAWGEPRFVLVMLLSILVNYLLGLRAAGNRGVVTAAVFFNIGILFIFKYLGFAATEVSALLSHFGSGLPADMLEKLTGIALPIGLSFFTFQGLSYVIDVYRGEVPAQRNLFLLALYIAMFPQLIAGPIVRYSDVAENFRERQTSIDDLTAGAQRFIIGLAKKVMIADIAAGTADKVFGVDLSLLTTSAAWIGAAAYTLQIYFDFSGYSDMAIGLGRIFGFHFNENFNLPYLSASVSEFWRRWHISLGTWFRDYVYIPLGGSRKGNVRTILNLLVVFLLTGLWHGAARTFLFWGLWHGCFVAGERIVRIRKGRRRGGLPGIVYTMLVVMTGWVFFRSATVTQGFSILAAMAGFSRCTFAYYGPGYFAGHQEVCVMIIGALTAFGVPETIWKAVCRKAERGDAAEGIVCRKAERGDAADGIVCRKAERRDAAEEIVCGKAERGDAADGIVCRKAERGDAAVAATCKAADDSGQTSGGDAADGSGQTSGDDAADGSQRIFIFIRSLCNALRYPALLILLLISCMMIINGNYSPFIYFRF